MKPALAKILLKRCAKDPVPSDQTMARNGIPYSARRALLEHAEADKQHNEAVTMACNALSLVEELQLHQDALESIEASTGEYLRDLIKRHMGAQEGEK